MTKRAVRKLLTDLVERCKISGNEINVNIDALVEDFLVARLGTPASKNCK